jgi:uncharacterized protein YjbI with pentapeptide repeats
MSTSLPCSDEALLTFRVRYGKLFFTDDPEGQEPDWDSLDPFQYHSSIEVTPEAMQEILRLHGRYLAKEEDGRLMRSYGLTLGGLDLRGVVLRETNLFGTHLCYADLSGADLQGVDIRCSNARFVNLSGANLDGALMTQVELRESNLKGASLRGANLQSAELVKANLKGADLRNTDLRNTDLCNCDLEGADLRGARLKGANLSEANVKDVRWSIPEEILLASWPYISTELTLELMRYEAAHHPNPDALVQWFSGGSSPEDGFERVADYTPDPGSWRPGPSLPAQVLVQRLIDERCSP